MRILLIKILNFFDRSCITDKHVLIFVLKLFKDGAALYFSGKFAHCNGVLYFTVSRPYLTAFFDLLDIIWNFRILWVFSWNKKKSSMIGAAKPLIILKTSIINTCKFLWCVIISLFACSSYSKVLVLSFIINLRDLSWILLISLFAFREQNIQTKRH